MSPSGAALPMPATLLRVAQSREVPLTSRVAAASLAAVLLSFGGAAILVRYVRLARTYSAIDVELQGDLTIEEDAEIGFVPPKRGSSFRRHPRQGIAYHLFTGDRRERISALGEASHERVDLLTVGCSFSWGHGIENQDTYTARLGRSQSLKVANLSLGSYGTVQSLLLMKRNLDLRPKVVVYGWIEDHFRRNVSPCAPNYAPYCLPTPFVALAPSGTPEISPPRSSFAENRRFYLEFLYSKELNVQKLWLLARADLARLLPASEREPTPAAEAEAFAFLMREMHRLVTAKGASLVVLHIPYMHLPEISDAPPLLRSAVAALGAHAYLVDMAPALRSHLKTSDQPLVIPDNHPSAAAHGVMAAELERFLLDRGLLASPKGT